MRAYILTGLRKAVEQIAKDWDDSGRITDALLAKSVAILLDVERYRGLEVRNELVNVAETIAKIVNSPNEQLIELIQVYREELNRKD